MAIKTDHEEIWKWYEILEDFRKSGLAGKEYCNKNNMQYAKFVNMIYRIHYKKYANPTEYNILLLLGRKYLNSGLQASKFAQANNIKVVKLSEVTTHIRYLDIIEKKLQEKAPERMKFIEVTAKPDNLISSPQQAEVIEKQNDIEIIISKGVKVSISSSIDSMKIIKIIELLKDL